MKRIMSLIILLGTFAGATIITQPSTMSVPYNQSTLKQVSYRFSMLECTEATSSEIQFLDTTGRIVDTTHKSATVRLTIDDRLYGIGTLAESVRISSSVLRKVRNAGGNSMRMQRTFECTAGVGLRENTSMGIRLTTQAGSAFSINRLQLFFPNNKVQTVVKRNEELQAVARINFNGSGKLRGYWEVDGRAYPTIIQMLTGRDSIVISFGPVLSLPTFNPGRHTVRFVITSPEADFKLPSISYLVDFKQSKPLLPIGLQSPKNEATLFLQSTRFKWNDILDGEVYLIQIFSEAGKASLFSAYTKKGEYRIPKKMIDTKLEAGRTYRWKVTGYDKDGKPIAESETRSFIMIFN